MGHASTCARGIRAALVVLSVALTGWLDTPEAWARPGAVRTFNLYLRNYFEPGDAQLLAKWDALGLDIDTPPSVLAEIKSFNPDIRLLAYLPINGTYANANVLPADSKWRAVWEAAEANDWWLRNTEGGLIYDHPNKRTTNLTAACPENALGETILEWFPRFIVQDVLQDGAAHWDGVILDDVWVGIWWINNNRELNPLPIDVDRDGLQEDQPGLDLLWKAGNDSIVTRIRRRMPAGEIIIGNGQNPFYSMNGSYIETFPYNGQLDPGHPLGYSWTDKMWGQYGYFANEAGFNPSPQRLNVLNAKWDEGGRYAPVVSPDFERHKRFCMASALLGDGYFSLDHHGATSAHDSIWWFPEYDKAIGTPVGAAFQATVNGMTLWRRNYTNGVVLVNPNYTTFTGSTSAGLPPIGWVDARVLLNSELWHSESTPPAAVTDLAVSRTWNNAAEVQWTNVGDDGTSGQAVAVEVRYSTQAITSNNWGQAAVAPGAPIPELPGVLQKLMINGLAGGRTYHFAMKTRDLSGNWSALSNVASGVTVVGDTTPPAAVTDLAVVSTTASGATVRWTSTGDDGPVGTPSTFDLRYATFPLTSANWGSAAQVVGEPAPGPAGTVHELALYAMAPGTTYYFGIKVGDEMPNWSGLSNIPSAATLAGDTTPPAAIADLRITGITASTITLTWTAPGDDGTTGRAVEYDLRYSTAPITPANFLSAAYITTEPGPALPGTTQSLTITLGIGYTYHFALRAADEWPNWSAPSNSVGATTNTIDLVAPAAVTGLSVTGSDTTSLTLSWTAPGNDGGSGTASGYDLRMSTSPITDLLFPLATPVPWVPLPAAAGTPQSMTVPGLSPGTAYSFALRTIDRHGNWSPLSNVVPPTSPVPPDLTPPAAPAGLHVAALSTTSVQLSWIAPGDDLMSGSASAYDVRHALTELSLILWGGAVPVIGEPSPAAPGELQWMTISGLVPATRYYFGVQAADEIPNWSGVSGAVSITLPTEVSGIEDGPVPPGDRFPSRPLLARIAPNPVRGQAEIELALPAGGAPAARLALYSVQGRLVRELHAGPLAAGPRTVRWDGRDDSGTPVPAGVYFAVLSDGASRDVRKLVVSR